MTLEDLKLLWSWCDDLERVGGVAGALINGLMVVLVVLALLRLRSATLTPKDEAEAADGSSPWRQEVCLLGGALLLAVYTILSIEAGGLVDIPDSVLILVGMILAYRLIASLLRTQARIAELQLRSSKGNNAPPQPMGTERPAKSTN